MNTNPLLRIAITAATAAARILEQRFVNDSGVRNAPGKDIKTEADLAAEGALLEGLATSGLPVLSEEGGGSSLCEVRSHLHWIIDPLDGTLNYTRRFPMACVSVALWERQNPELAVIVDLARNRIFRGVVGQGCWEGDQLLVVSKVADVGQSVLATGFPTGRNFDSDRIMAFVSAVQHFKKVRLLGSAALSLSYVAEGVFDAYCEEDIWIWDVAAGIALVIAAGGALWMTPPNEKGQVTVFASNGLIVPPDTLFAAHENLEKYTNA